MDKTRVSETPSYFKKVMLHEYIMLIFLIEVVLRLIFKQSNSIWLIYYIMVAGAYSGMIYWGIKSKALRINQLRLFASFFVMNFCYSSTKYIVPALNIPILDNKLANIDNIIIGGDLSLWAQNIYSRPLTELLSFVYTFHFVPFICAVIYYAFFSDMKKTYVFYSGIFSVLAFGFIGYSFIPAQGPFVYFKDLYTQDLVGYYYTAINAKIVTSGSSVFDVFPSMHVGVATYLLLFFFGNNKRAYKFYAPLYVLIVCSTIYLRYHYVIDILCGAIISIVCYSVCEKLVKLFEEGEETYELYNGIPETS